MKISLFGLATTGPGKVQTMISLLTYYHLSQIMRGSSKLHRGRVSTMNFFVSVFKSSTYFTEGRTDIIRTSFDKQLGLRDPIASRGSPYQYF